MFANLQREEGLGIGVALVAHVALAALLVMQDSDRSQFAPVERIDVSFANEVSLESTAPDPSAEPAASFAPEVAEMPQAPEEAVSEPIERPVERAITPPRPTTRATTRATPTPTPTTRATQRSTPAPAATATQRAQGSRMGEDFLEGRSDAEGTRGSPAATFGPTEAAALNSAVTRQLRPHWSAPSGVDVDQIVTVISWELNTDGSLRGVPRMVSQTGINDSNRPQAGLHAERAIRAVQLAAPFNLPEQYYSRWRRLQWTFDRRL